MRRSVMAGAVLTVGTVLGVLTPVAGSTTAWADGPQHVVSPFTVDTGAAAGKFCDFAIHNVGTGTDNIVMFPDRTIDHIDLQIAHINVDTGFTLTETDHWTEFTATNGTNGTTRDVGVFWHLRNADGKIVLVQAGQLVISGDEVLKFTPNTNPDRAAVICTALGGHPAPLP